MYIKNKRGQSTVEYVLLVTAVIAVIIALVTSNKGGLQSQMTNTLNQAINDVGDMQTRLSAAHAASATGGNGTPPYSVNAAP